VSLVDGFGSTILQFEECSKGAFSRYRMCAMVERTPVLDWPVDKLRSAPWLVVGLRTLLVPRFHVNGF